MSCAGAAGRNRRCDWSGVPWHQDTTYANFGGGRHVRAWVAFTDSHSGNGCMRVIKGSHRQQLRHVETPDDDNNILFRKESIAETIDESRAADLTLKAGEMSVHDYGVVHGSNSNESDDRRIGFAIAFVTPDSLAPGERETVMLVRGREATGQWDLELRPKADQGPDAQAEHARAMATRSAVFFDQDASTA
ncbi:MAG: phytanoyl-CoA dioxygenase family protein [Alphaproteobacteria bacterium]|nr:phytanoyl-CoA dioxygenase family protein [Alphaproteobacteria bacterium]